MNNELWPVKHRQQPRPLIKQEKYINSKQAYFKPYVRDACQKWPLLTKKPHHYWHGLVVTLPLEMVKKIVRLLLSKGFGRYQRRHHHYIQRRYSCKVSFEELLNLIISAACAFA